jgi:hypothetical protein
MSTFYNRPNDNKESLNKYKEELRQQIIQKGIEERKKRREEILAEKVL